MFRKVLFGLVALAGLTFVSDTSTADAGWRRGYRGGYYAPYRGYYGGYRGYYPRRAYSYGYYPGGYYYGSPAYYAPPYYYGGYYPGYYGGYGYGPGFGVATRNFGFYVR